MTVGNDFYNASRTTAGNKQDPSDKMLVIIVETDKFSESKAMWTPLDCVCDGAGKWVPI